MKIIISILVFLVFTSAFSYDDYSVKGEVDANGFIVGKDDDLGSYFYYIVDRTNGLCFAGVGYKMSSSGLTEVDCEKLKGTRRIKKYLETGKAE